VEAVAWGGQRLALAPAALERVAAGRARLLELLAGGARVYGVNTGTGYLAAVDLAAGMDAVAVALVQAAELASQRLHRLLDGRFSGLPDQLTPLPGPRVGLVVVHKRAVGR
jgi:histidine ammonia-lyase